MEIVQPFIKAGAGVTAEEAFQRALYYHRATSFDLVAGGPAHLGQKDGIHRIYGPPKGAEAFIAANHLLKAAPYNDPSYTKAGCLQVTDNVWVFFGTARP